MTTSLEDITLEEFKAGNASVEKTLLVVSGLSTEDAVEQYVAKLDKLEKNFKRKMNGIGLLFKLCVFFMNSSFSTPFTEFF